MEYDTTESQEARGVKKAGTCKIYSGAIFLGGGGGGGGGIFFFFFLLLFLY